MVGWTTARKLRSASQMYDISTEANLSMSVVKELNIPQVAPPLALRASH